MTPLERARARLGNVTPAGQGIVAHPDGGGLAVPDAPAQPDVHRDLKPAKVTVTLTVLEELIASTRRIEAAAGGSLPPRTMAIQHAQNRLDEIGRQLAAGRASRADFTAALELYEGLWVHNIGQARRP